ncbi:MAG: aconitate hydratase [Caldisericaceae bacterium]|nr:aconitate hydratase [Caldisericaceae bacterium]
MGKNIIEKIIESHIVDGIPKKGEEIGIHIDQTLTQDATGTATYLEFEAMGFREVKTEAVSYIDHNTVQVGFENADDHRYLQTVAKKYGIILSRPGNGICHQIQLEQFAKPGNTLIGSDSHTPTAGGIGEMAIGVGGLDVAVGMGGGPFYLTYPKIIKIELTGKLQHWVSAKDVILKILSMLTTKGNVGYAIEYGGDGVKTLTIPERATITNMGAETGVTTSIFPSDEQTHDFMKKQRREKDWIPLEADPDAHYDKIIKINLSEIEPMVACPDSPGNVKTVKEIAELKVDQIAIGSCTNSSYKDLMTVAHILKGHTTNENLEFGVAPGSKQVIEMIEKDGGLSSIIKAGARIFESACGFCIGNSFAPGTDAVSVRTNNRNFKGRCGTKSAKVYLVSPETAAATAITGKITDPRNLEKMGIKYEEIKIPETFEIDKSMFIFPLPEEEREKIEIFKGPNIKSIPKNESPQEIIKGTVIIKVGDKITTDHIMPAGPYLKYRSNVPEYATHVFESIDPHFAERALKNKEHGIANIIVGGESYGQGSSREHAALCPMYLGVKVVIAKTIERIHQANLVNFGIVPLLFDNPSDYNEIEQGDSIEITHIKKAIENGEKNIKAKNTTKNKEITLKLYLSNRQQKIILAGGLLPFTAQGDVK